MSHRVGLGPPGLSSSSPSAPVACPSVAAAASPTPVFVQGTVDFEGSSFVAPAQRRYHTRVGPTPLLPPQPRGDIISGGPHRPRGPGPWAQGSHQLRDPRRQPHRLIRALLEPQTYPLHPLSGGLTSLATPSRGMLTVEGEISMGRFTTISRHLLLLRSPETPCSSCIDTI